MKGRLAHFDAGCLDRPTPLGCESVCRAHSQLEDCVVRTVDGGPEEVYLTPVIYYLEALGPSFSRCSQEQGDEVASYAQRPPCP
jgi:hypothetical protein